ncbi:MAG: glycosyltransferase family 4 protein, partial [Acidimicrobiia bacterium]|nr:glycosyltransferase family 4 protein [Acidimicrobiia bacterium]
VRFRWVKAPGYSGNTLARFFNMVVFALRVWSGRSTRDLPEPDVVIGSSPHLFGADAAARLAKRRRVPFVLEIRDLWPLTLVDVGGFSTRHPAVVLMSWLERRLYREADAITTVLPRAADHLQTFGVEESSVTWIPNGVDLADTPEPAPLHDHDEFVVLYLGSHGAGNNLGVVLDAAVRLQTDGDDRFLFRFVGDGPEKARLEESAKRRGLTNVAFEPPVPKHDAPHVLATADACIAILPPKVPLHRFGMSLNKLFDYLAAGRPVVFGAETPSDPVRDAQAGYTVPQDDIDGLVAALRTLADLDVAERIAMGERGRRFVADNHDFKKLASRLEALLVTLTED